jgi:hypothetical protein
MVRLAMILASTERKIEGKRKKKSTRGGTSGQKYTI